MQPEQMDAGVQYTSPINNYNVTLCIGDYVNFSEQYISDKDTLQSGISRDKRNE